MGHSINNVLAIGCIVYSCTFFKYINSAGCFHVTVNCQLDLFTPISGSWPKNQCVSTQLTVFSIQPLGDRPIVSSFENIIGL